MRREPATALARAASAAAVDGAGAIVAGIFGEVSALERACVDDEEVREGSRARQSRARVRRPDPIYLLARTRQASVPVDRFSTSEKSGECRGDVAFRRSRFFSQQ
jgi:hypothetical protein